MKIRFQILLAALAVWISAGSTMAADVSAKFDVANKLYAEGKFADAAATYEKILQSGAVSPALYFNYGNAEFKAGNLGRAIAAYRQAEQLSPRDADVRANLEFARSQVQGVKASANRWENWLGTLTLNEWTALAAVSFWLTFVLLAIMQIWPALKTVLGGFTRAVAIVMILSGVDCGAAVSVHISKKTVVAVAPDVLARSGPFDDAQNVFTAHDGAELAVLSRRGDWVQVADGSGKIGWLEREQVEILPRI
ncbi:MAG TPA: tetratricopeptide repeat protein [Candidatus Dormibacteraeota bacterium]|nr:tetratricopeptide repeat protein [Candidatus Dormibacteraeota bacterium]